MSIYMDLLRASLIDLDTRRDDLRRLIGKGTPPETCGVCGKPDPARTSFCMDCRLEASRLFGADGLMRTPREEEE